MYLIRFFSDHYLNGELAFSKDDLILVGEEQMFKWVEKAKDGHNPCDMAIYKTQMVCDLTKNPTLKN